MDEWHARHAPLPRWWADPRPWWAWSVGALLLGLGALLGAGVLLAGADLGTSLRERSCDASPLAGLALLALGGAASTLGFQFVRLHGEGSVLVWGGLTPLLVAAPLPLTVLALALPGSMGCASAADIAALPAVGDAFVGVSGIALAAAAATLSGAALASSVHVSWIVPVGGAGEHPPDLVELAMEEAEALETDPIASRFRGVD